MLLDALNERVMLRQQTIEGLAGPLYKTSGSHALTCSADHSILLRFFPLLGVWDVVLVLVLFESLVGLPPSNQIASMSSAVAVGGGRLLFL